NSYLDTGNKLHDPYNKAPIILLNKKLFPNNISAYIYVPYNTINNEGILKCIKLEKIVIEGVGERKNVLAGLTDNIKIDAVDCILNMKLLEE
ncbi:MAG: sigma-E processing peptidase SpoIIGA, partial [Bacilli bacterium]